MTVFSVLRNRISQICTIRAKLPRFADFNINQKATINAWRDHLFTDLAQGKPIRTSRLWQTLQSMENSERKQIFFYLNESKLFVKLPPGKIFLSKEFQELVDMSIAPIKATTPGHIILMLYSLRSYKEQKPMDAQRVQNIADKIKVLLSDKSLKKDSFIGLQIPTIKQCLVALNKYMPSKPIRTIEFTVNNWSSKNGGSKYSMKHHRPIFCRDDFWDNWNGVANNFTEDIVTHEGSHGIFNVRFSDLSNRLYSNNKNWNQIYALSLNNSAYLMVKDSCYLEGPLLGLGHPYDNPNELFASSVVAFRNHHDQMLRNIKDPETPPHMKTFALMVYAFLRDEVFMGVFRDKKLIPIGSAEYMNDHLLPKKTFEEIVRSIGPKEIEAALVSGLSDKEETIISRTIELIEYMQLPISSNQYSLVNDKLNQITKTNGKSSSEVLTLLSKTAKRKRI
jgi:hypothetical protein